MRQRAAICLLVLGMPIVSALLAAPVPEPKGLYTDAEAETFAKSLACLKLPNPVNLYDVMKQLKIDPERLGPVEHLPGNATDWYRFPLSKSYALVGTKRLTSDAPAPPPEKGKLIVNEVDIRKREP